mgnify:CR=1 FL=1
MCTSPQGVTNSITHMMNNVHKVLQIPHITMPFLDDIPVKGCEERMKNEELNIVGCWKFARDHIEDCDKVLSRLEGVHRTLSAPKAMFAIKTNMDYLIGAEVIVETNCLPIFGFIVNCDILIWD